MASIFDDIWTGVTSLISTVAPTMEVREQWNRKPP